MAKQGIGAAFRAMHHGDKAFVIPNPWDVGLRQATGGPRVSRRWRPPAQGSRSALASEMAGRRWTK